MFDSNQFFGAQAEEGFYPTELEQSLRFNDDDSAYLSWTPASAGNRKTWTWSGWVKRGNLGSRKCLFGVESTQTYIMFDSDKLDFVEYQGGIAGRKLTNALYRDTSAWYHIVGVWDSTNSTASDRMRLYVNGERVDSFSSSVNPSQNLDSAANNTVLHAIGREELANTDYFDGYLAEVNFIDGQALDADSFGEFKSGVWVPKAYTGTYGTNGFYLPFKNDYTVEGFSTVTYQGNGSTQYIGGVGFEPDLVWIKKRSGSVDNHVLQDSVRGVGKGLFSDLTNAENSTMGGMTSFDSDGFTFDGSISTLNGSGFSMVAWCWDAGTGSPVSNTDGSITSTVKANPDRGFSIVSWVGNGVNTTVGHGLNSAPEMVIVKNRDTVYNWFVDHVGLSTVNEFLALNLTNGEITDARTDRPFGTHTSTTLAIGADGEINNLNDNIIAYCFHSVSGYSDFGSYTGTGSAGNKITTGFKPAFVMIKRTDTSGYSWFMYDNTRDPANPNTKFLFADASNAEVDNTASAVDFDSDGFTVDSTWNDLNASGGTYIYMAFADKREAAFWLDDSGNNNDWTNNNLTESDIVLDSPTNNFTTLNALDTAAPLTEGNLEITGNNSWRGTKATNYLPVTGKYYFEVAATNTSQRANGGFVKASTQNSGGPSGGSWQQLSDGFVGIAADSVNFNFYGPASSSPLFVQSGTSSGPQTISFAVDVDTGKVWMGRNGTYYDSSGNATGNPSAGTNETATLSNPQEYVMAAQCYDNAVNVNVNFGQDSSFAGNKTAQGNTDANGIGDFYYTPPSGYLALCTSNLPEPAFSPADDASPQDHFNTVLYSGNSSTQSVTGVGFQPDFTWIKSRNIGGANHVAVDAVRGVNKFVLPNLTDAELNVANTLTSFDSDGFSLGQTNYDFNISGNNYVAWNWKANGSGVSNTDGSITSTVSANTDAGFSIATYTGTGANATVGHGLDSAPEMVICKARDASTGWAVGHTGAGFTKFMYLDTTASASTNSTAWNNTDPTSSVVSFGTGTLQNASGVDFVMYAFHSVEGFSKFGSYTGNGSSDGTFVYTGFKPAFFLVKQTDGTGSWYMFDNKRDDDNVVQGRLIANASNAESTDINTMDFVSNGFKLRDTNTVWNGSGNSYIYMAFAENPFKYTTAR